MRIALRQMAVGLLALWLALMSGVIYPQITTKHVAAHAHHNADTHATPLCSWVCLMAETAAEASLDVAPYESVISKETTYLQRRIDPSIAWQPPSRAPPLSRIITL